MSLFNFWKTKSPINEYVDEFSIRMQEAGYPVKIAEVRRTAARQKELYAQGRTRPGEIVTWTTKSKHITGRAFDFDFLEPSDNSDPDAWEIAGEVGVGMGLSWGGDWNVQDLRHFELDSNKS